VVPIEVPPLIKDDELFHLEKYPQKAQILREISLRTLSRYKDYPDVIIYFSRKGKPIFPSDTFNPNALFSCKRDTIRYCLGSGWTSYEDSVIRWHMDRIIPIIESIYGRAMMKNNPLGNPWFRIVKAPSLPTSFMCPPIFASVCQVVFSLDPPCTPSYYLWDENGYIVLNVSSFDTCSTCYNPILLTHEVVHAFRGNRVLFWSQFEEGHAEAVSMLAHKIMCLTYGKYCGSWNNKYTFDPAYVFHQYLNLPFIGTNATRIPWEYSDIWYSPLISLRYKAFSYLWIKTFIVNPNIFKNLNDSLCEKPPLPFWTDLNSYQEYKLMAEKAFGAYTIEGKSFINWFNSQPAFYNFYPTTLTNLRYELGIFPYFYGSMSIGLNIYYYKRKRDFSIECPVYCEEPVPNRTLRFLGWGPDGRIFMDTLLITDSYGRASIIVDVHRVPGCRESEGQSGICRIKVEVCDTLYCDGDNDSPPIFAERIFSFPANRWKDIFGAVGAERNIVVHTPLTTLDTNGAFFSPYPPGARSITVNYTSGFLGYMETQWVKDSLPNFIYPGLYSSIPIFRNLRIPPARPQNLSILYLDTLNDSVSLAWSSNREADFERYIVYASWDYSTFYAISGTRDSSITLRTYPCISNRFFIVPKDIYGNKGESSDTIDIFYIRGGYPCFSNVSSPEILYRITPQNILQFDLPKPTQVKVYSVSGRLIFNGMVYKHKVRLERGVYFIVIGNEIKKEVLR